jgi:hypothetical protein
LQPASLLPPALGPVRASSEASAGLRERTGCLRTRRVPQFGVSAVFAHASIAFQSQTAETPMTEERKHAILLATAILTARKLQPLLEEGFAVGKPNMRTEFWAEIYTKKSIQRAAHILVLIDAKWPTTSESLKAQSA